MKKYRFEIILFIIDAISMILELVASRILSPYFGNSNLIWTSVIGIILLSSSIGNYFGGIIADKENVNKKLKMILVLAAICVFLIPIYQESVILVITGITSSIKLGAIICSILLFFVPSLLMGLLTPIIVKLKLEDLKTAGKISGRINAIATIGGITGTFLGGFFLIPKFGSIHILYMLTILILFMIPLVDYKIEKYYTLFIVIMTSICIILMKLSIDNNVISGEKVISGNDSLYVSYDTQYGRVLIYNSQRDNEKIRVLNIDSGYESVTYTEEDKVYELASEYTKYYDLMFKKSGEIKETLMIGGAGYSYPKYFISHFKDIKMDVVEIDGEITEIAKKYFYLDRLIKEYNINETKRLNLITEDGRTYLNNNTKKYDVILNDAFSGSSPAKTLTTIEAAEKIRISLNENGMYLTNIISSLEGEESKFIRAEVNTLKKIFKNVYVIPCKGDANLNKVQNNMVIATDEKIEFENEYNLKIEDNEIVITDDYCPVDALVPKSIK